jgi:hypothetical protein
MDYQLLIQQGRQLFDKRTQLLSLWQEIADNFYPERAEFTTTRNLGDEFAAHLMSSYPVLARRDLGNSLGTMLRPTSKDWFKIRTSSEGREDTESRAWLEWATDRQKRAMYDRRSGFVRATKAGDHDFAAFGQCVISVEMNPMANGLLYRCWHLRDVVWMENAIGEANTIYRRWKPTVQTLNSVFKNCHPDIKKKMEKDPHAEVECWHVVIPSEQFFGKKDWKTPYVSIHYDVTHNHCMEEQGIFHKFYVIPRWQTPTESQYAYSPATIAALPDARLIQAMTRVLLEAGEKAVDPPMLAVQEAIRSDISIFAGGITWVDAEYDERLGEVLRPLTQDKTGIPLGLEMQQDTRQMIAEAFYLNKLNLPQPGPEMTAYEVGQRVQEYIRQAMPIFEPMETEYNGALCEMTFDLMLRAGGFGSPHDMPKRLHGADIQFVFESPLRDATERAKGQRMLEAQQFVANAAALDKSAPAIIDVKAALRDVLTAIGVPAKWTRTEAAVAEMEAQQQAMEQTQQFLAAAQQGADVAATLGQVAPPAGVA